MKKLVAVANGEADTAVAFGKNTLVGYYDQENKNMTPGKTVLQEIWDAYPSLLEYGSRSMLGRCLLYTSDVYKRQGPEPHGRGCSCQPRKNSRAD